MSRVYEYMQGSAEPDVVEFTLPPDVEAVALRLALLRLERDNYALQQSLHRVTAERDQWRNAYNAIGKQS